MELKGKDIYLLSIQLRDGTVLDFSSDPSGFAILRDTLIIRDTRNNEIEFIPLSKVDITTAYRQSTGTEDIGNVLICSVVVYLLAFFSLRFIRFPGWGS